MRITTILALALLLSACGWQETSWLKAQKERCAAMGGRGAYNTLDKLFECFQSKKPFSFKIEMNKEVDFKQPGVTKLFEAKYAP